MPVHHPPSSLGSCSDHMRAVSMMNECAAGVHPAAAAAAV